MGRLVLLPCPPAHAHTLLQEEMDLGDRMTPAEVREWAGAGRTVLPSGTWKIPMG